MTVEPRTELRITCPERYIDNAGSHDTKCRNGHYIIVETSLEDEVARFLRNEFTNKDFITPGECVDVEIKFKEYLGRFRLNSKNVLVKLPPQPVLLADGEEETS